MKTYAFRLGPGEDLREKIDRFVKEHDMKAGVVVSCVGSLKKAVLRMAGAKPGAEDIRAYEGSFEILGYQFTCEEAVYPCTKITFLFILRV